MKRYILILFICSLGAFLALSKFEDRKVLRSLDFAVTVKIQDKIDTSRRLRTVALVDSLMQGSVFFAGPLFTVFMTLIYTGIAGYDRQNKRVRWQAIAIPIALTAIVAIEVFAKSAVHHPSPPFSMIKHPVSMFPDDYVNAQFSYPSGHAARAVFLALGAFSLMVRRGQWKRNTVLVMSLGAYVALVCLSKIYLGHHWFSDIAGGLLLGTGAGGAFLLFLKQRPSVASEIS